jgi:hypothetical protein
MHPCPVLLLLLLLLLLVMIYDYAGPPMQSRYKTAL